MGPSAVGIGRRCNSSNGNTGRETRPLQREKTATAAPEFGMRLFLSYASYLPFFRAPSLGATLAARASPRKAKMVPRMTETITSVG